MPRKRHKSEEIVAKLRQVDVLVSQGQGVADAVRSIGVTEVTYYRWRQEYGGLGGRRRAGRADLAVPRTEGPGEATQAWPALAGGRLLRPVAGRTPEPRLVLRLRRGSHP